MDQKFSTSGILIHHKGCANSRGDADPLIKWDQEKIVFLDTKHFNQVIRDQTDHLSNTDAWVLPWIPTNFENNICINSQLSQRIFIPQ